MLDSEINKLALLLNTKTRLCLVYIRLLVNVFMFRKPAVFSLKQDIKILVYSVIITTKTKLCLGRLRR